MMLWFLKLKQHCKTNFGVLGVHGVHQGRSGRKCFSLPISKLHHSYVPHSKLWRCCPMKTDRLYINRSEATQHASQAEADSKVMPDSTAASEDVRQGLKDFLLFIFLCLTLFICYTFGYLHNSGKIICIKKNGYPPPTRNDKRQTVHPINPRELIKRLEEIWQHKHKKANKRRHWKIKQNHQLWISKKKFRWHCLCCH